MSDFKQRTGQGLLADVGFSACVLNAQVEHIGRQHEREVFRLFDSLTSTDRYNRFGHVVSDCVLESHVRQAMTNAKIVAARVDEHIRGVAEVYCNTPGRIAEAAFVVEPGWQRKGLGSLLLRAASDVAAADGDEMLRVVFSRNNWAMRKLALKSGGTLDIVCDEIVVDLVLLRRRDDRAAWML